ncbi:MAG: toprim domain-containing protein [bacterium]|nr:toprim domain-containing protein [bacterium]
MDRELALRADLLRPSDRGGEPFAYFRNRIIFPVKIISRQVAGFGGRIIDQGEPKYLNSSDSAYFNKGKLLYGFEASRMAIARQKCAVLVEGYLDLLALAQAGFTNVVATCGTAFTPEQAKLLRRGARDVILMFDGDKAGLKAAVRSADIALRCGLEPRIVRLPAGKDPADLAIAGGAAPIEQALKDAIGYVPFLKRLADARGGDRTLSERAVRQILATVAGIEDPLRREYVLQEAADVSASSATCCGTRCPRPGRETAASATASTVAAARPPRHRRSMRRRRPAVATAAKRPASTRPASTGRRAHAARASGARWCRCRWSASRPICWRMRCVTNQERRPAKWLPREICPGSNRRPPPWPRSFVPGLWVRPRRRTSGSGCCRAGTAWGMRVIAAM